LNHPSDERVVAVQDGRHESAIVPIIIQRVERHGRDFGVGTDSPTVAVAVADLVYVGSVLEQDLDHVDLFKFHGLH
jgi:hypothetical protein